MVSVATWRALSAAFNVGCAALTGPGGLGSLGAVWESNHEAAVAADIMSGKCLRSTTTFGFIRFSAEPCKAISSRVSAQTSDIKSARSAAGGKTEVCGYVASVHDKTRDVSTAAVGKTLLKQVAARLSTLSKRKNFFHHSDLASISAAVSRALKARNLAPLVASKVLKAGASISSACGVSLK